MSNPDEAVSGAKAALEAVSRQAGHLWIAAHAEGVRNGMEFAAQAADDTIAQMRDNYDLDTDLRIVGVLVLEGFRDNLRLAALTSLGEETDREVG